MIYQTKKRFRAYIPKDLDWEKYFPNEKQKELDLYRLFISNIYNSRVKKEYLIQYISLKEIYNDNKLIELHEGYVPISSDIMQSYLSNYEKIKKILQDKNIIQIKLNNKGTETYYNNEGKGESKRYRINPELLTSGVRCEWIQTNTTLLKKINNNKQNMYLNILNKIDYKLMKSLDNVEIKYEEALEKIKSLYENHERLDAIDYTIHSINLIKDKEFYIVPDNFGRVHTNITNLKTEARQFLYFKNSNIPLVNIDIKNSQPYFLSLLLNKELLRQFEIYIPKPIFNYLIDMDTNEDIDKYTELVCNGILYDKIAKETNQDRSRVKHDVMILLYDNYIYDNKTNFWFKQNLQGFVYLLEILKSKRDKEFKNYLPQLLQRIEAYFMYEVIIQDVINKDIYFENILTIHDSILIEDDDTIIGMVKDSIVNAFNQYGHNPPKIKLER